MFLTNANDISTLKAIVDNVVLPPYAKFIFSISDRVKNTIAEFLFYYFKNSSNTTEGFNDFDRLTSFLNTFYSNSDCCSSLIHKSNFNSNFSL